MAKRTASPSRGRPTGNDGAARRELLAAARREFAHRGYSGARTRTIIEAAGVTPPVLYHHFGNKAGLYLAVTTEVNDLVLESFTRALEGRSQLLERIGALLEASVAIQADDAALAEFVIAAPIDFARNPELEALRPQLVRLRRFVREVLEGSDDAEEADIDDVLQVVMVVVFGLSRIALHQRAADYRHTVDVLLDVVRRGLA